MRPPYIKLPLKFILLWIPNIILVFGLIYAFDLPIPLGKDFWIPLTIAGILALIEQWIWDRIHGIE